VLALSRTQEVTQRHGAGHRAGREGAPVKVIDTNVLVRFLVHDDPRQAQAARHLI
jgi:hypothetical protein